MIEADAERQGEDVVNLVWSDPLLGDGGIGERDISPGQAPLNRGTAGGRALFSSCGRLKRERFRATFGEAKLSVKRGVRIAKPKNECGHPENDESAGKKE